MKKLTLFTIRIYQSVVSTTLKQLLGIAASCRYPESCSAYAMRVIAKTGVIRGSVSAFSRILRCNALFN